MNGNGRVNKRQRVEEEQPDTVDVKLSQELRELLGGRTYVKEEELTRNVLLEWAKRQDAVKDVNLISITVQANHGRHRAGGEIGKQLLYCNVTILGRLGLLIRRCC